MGEIKKQHMRERVKVFLNAISPKLATTINYRYSCGEWLNWVNPQDINAKIQWLKVHTYYNNPLVTNCIDKYRIREYLDQKGLSSICPKLYGAYDHPEDIDWDSLPNKFAVKCNHGCGMNIIVSDKSSLNIPEAVNTLKAWMKQDYWKSGEVQYRFIKKKIVIEEYLGAGEDLKTVKFFCFNGIPKVCYISLEEDRYIDYFTCDFEKMPYVLSGHEHYPNDYEKPKTFDKMVELAKVLSEDFPFVRVDLYDALGEIYISELTFIPTAGFMKIDPPKTLVEWGAWLELPSQNGLKT